MSITALVTGKLIADPERRTGQSGKTYVLAKIAAHEGDADSLVSVMAFGSTADQLAAMAKGDALAVNGRAKVNTWAGRDGATKAGLSVMADSVLSAYHVRRRRKDVADAQATGTEAQPDSTQPACGDAGPWLAGGEQ